MRELTNLFRASTLFCLKLKSAEQNTGLSSTSVFSSNGGIANSYAIPGSTNKNTLYIPTKFFVVF